MGLLRYQIFLVYIVAFLSLWYSLRQRKDVILHTVLLWIPKSFDTGDYPIQMILFNLIDYAPVILILALGIYAFISIAVGIIMLRDCPEASSELDHQIKEAREDMVWRGVIKK